MAEINLHLDLRFGPRLLRGDMTIAMLLAAAMELGSENVTLTTYYPAPTGIYTRMITTGSTTLARDGGTVAVGSAGHPTSLNVVGTAAATNLQVNGTAAAAGACSPNGLIAQDGTGRLFSCQSGAWQGVGAAHQGLYFGGVYGLSSGGYRVNNPLTGGASCPAGFTDAMMYDFYDYYHQRDTMHYCYKF